VNSAKRLLDVTASAAGLVALSPLLAAIALLVKVGDGGPVLFVQERVGRGGRPFPMLKFRTMVVGAQARGGQLTVGEDGRVTRVGRYLRRLKVDELPQLLNVLRGEMSLVGPRPEVPRFVALYSPEQRKVLELRPGITDPASVVFADEGELLARAAEPEHYYIETVMPAKIRINLHYARSASVLADVAVVVATLVGAPTLLRRLGYVPYDAHGLRR
jgi:lipopolysaccharide/colanic/teichoic acid biosynthesis glycosyltransferase